MTTASMVHVHYYNQSLWQNNHVKLKVAVSLIVQFLLLLSPCTSSYLQDSTHTNTNTERQSNVSFVTSQHRNVQTTISCTGVNDEVSLLNAINTATSSRFFATRITICNNIQLSTRQNYNYSFPYGNTKFDISNRNIALICGRIVRQRPERCRLSGSNKGYRMFYGMNTIFASQLIDYVGGGNNNGTMGNVERGGAFYITGSSRVTFRDTNFIDNTVSQAGGAIYIDDKSQLTISSSTSSSTGVNFDDNYSTNVAGAIAIASPAVTFKTTTSSTSASTPIASFRNNIATNFGGAIAFSFQTIFPTFTYSSGAVVVQLSFLT
jgi:predicted outer membrane repeat protein